MRENTIITISRQYGSGGREIASKLAKKLNIRCYDKKVVSIAAEKLGNSHEEIERIIEDSYQMPILKTIGLYGTLPEYNFIPESNLMYKEQATVIRTIAENSSAVFLGRCADAVLSEDKNAYHFFIYADDDFREKRGKIHYDSKTLKELEKEDKARERYYNYYTGRVWGKPQNYNLMINTSRVGLDEAVELIIDYIEKVQK